MVVIDTLTQTLDDSRELFEMGKSEDDDDTILAVQDDLLGAEKTLETLEFRRMFSNPMNLFSLVASCLADITQFDDGFLYVGARD